VSSTFNVTLGSALAEAASREPSRRRRRRMRATSATIFAVAVLGAVGVVTLGDAPAASAHLEVTHHDGQINVIFDEVARLTPREVETELAAAGIRSSVRSVPVSPSRVGKVVGNGIPEGDASVVHIVTLEGQTWARGLEVPEGWPGRLRLLLGREAKVGEPYEVVAPANAPGEPLACKQIEGQTPDAVARLAEKRRLHVTWEMRAGAVAQRLDSSQLGPDVAVLRADMVAPGEVRIVVAPKAMALSPMERSNPGC
jgi:hypothetical protein